MLELTKFATVLTEVLSNPFLYLIAMLIGVIYSMVKAILQREKENNQEKSEMVDKVLNDAKETRQLLSRAQENQSKFTQTLEVQMAEHRSALTAITAAVSEMRNDLNNVKTDLKGEIDNLKDDIHRNR